uniref:DNA polymerase epsilon catalytic subunit n=1 Tax=Dermatophagoides pteronyssinus TaxID=6956 RepID=A0A6P6Y4D8_DERPT|nr:DNA polymerase epsilon catalytic subunit A-like [Dermatophagoides pteronyssinus]
MSAKLNRNRVGEKKVFECTASVCQRSIDFYVSTVKDFRDRRFVFKKLKKKAENGLRNAHYLQEAELQNKVIYYESLQLAYKCILNSFYGYVMRKGARWHSMETAAITTYTGGNIIKLAKKICAGVGLPLELDTDGIWTLFPSNFPTNFEAGTGAGRCESSFTFSYPCWMLNGAVAEYCTNSQYLTWNGYSFERSNVNTIYFELDGPYKAMFLPASEKKDAQLKKRYVVYNKKGDISELKGFELKRRGELEMLKLFQKKLFPLYISASSKSKIFQRVSDLCDNWLRFLSTKGKYMANEKVVLSLLSESTTISKSYNATPNKKTMSMQYLVSKLDDIAWLLNVRGNSIEHAPVVTSFLLLSASSAVWYLRFRQLTCVPYEKELIDFAAELNFGP